jgi:Flp pilus assembly CpaE family ATPase
MSNPNRAFGAPCSLPAPQNSYRVLLVAEEPEDIAAVREMLPKTEAPSFSLAHALTMLDALDCVARERLDAILLGLQLPDSHGLEALQALRTHAPGVPILVWTSVESQQVARATVKAGAQDYLVKRYLNGPALARALHFAVMRHSAQPTAAPVKDDAVMIGVMGAKGGVGTTTLACYLSVALREATGKSTLLADLDLSAGQIAFLMEATSSYSIMDATANLHRLDGDYWEALTAAGAGDVTVIRSPAQITMADLPTVQRIRHVFRFLRTRYPWLVLDLARFGFISAELSRELSHLLLVTTPDVPSLLEAKQIVLRLGEAGIPREKMRLILNRRPRNSVLTQAEVEKLLGAPVYSLPNNYAALTESYAIGQLMPMKTDLRQQITRLARELAGADALAEAPLSRLKNGTAALLKRCTSGSQASMPLPAHSFVGEDAQ